MLFNFIILRDLVVQFETASASVSSFNTKLGVGFVKVAIWHILPKN